MRHLWTAVVLAAAIAVPPTLGARGSGGSFSGSHASASHSSSSHSRGTRSGGSNTGSGSSTHSGTRSETASGSHSSSGSHKSTYAAGAKRDSHGKIARSEKSKDEFKKQHPCPSTGKTHGSCPGYVIDHVTPLKRGGADAPSNMQWQTTEAAKIKDRTE